MINLIRTLLLKSLKKDLEKIKVRMKEHVRTFNEKADVGRLQRPVHTILLQRNPDFIDRERELQKLFTILLEADNQASPTSCMIHGIGGLGKSQTALEFAHKYSSHYYAVFWVRAGNRYDLLRTYGAIGRKLELFDADDIRQPHLERIQHWLETTGNLTHAC